MRFLMKHYKMLDNTHYFTGGGRYKKKKKEIKPKVIYKKSGVNFSKLRHKSLLYGEEDIKKKKKEIKPKVIYKKTGVNISKLRHKSSSSLSLY